METESIAFNRHEILPQWHNAEELAAWLESSAVDRFTDKTKRVFTPEELDDFARESSKNGREMNRLDDLLAQAAAHVKKGSPEPLVLTLPVTDGKELLTKFRRQNDDLIEEGVEWEEQEIFGIPAESTATMEYFTIDGVHIEERSRPLSAKERHKYLGIFDSGKSKMFVHKKGNVDKDSGELTDDERNGTND